MTLKDFALRLGGTIFGIVAVLHLLRIVTGIAVTIGTWLLPLWVNWMGLFGAGLLCVWLWWLSFGKADDSHKHYEEKYTYP